MRGARSAPCLLELQVARPPERPSRNPFDRFNPSRPDRHGFGSSRCLCASSSTGYCPAEHVILRVHAAPSRRCGRRFIQRLFLIHEFSDLGLPPELLRAVTEKGYDTPTPIQAQAIPSVLADRDVLAGAQTGTGKTAAFVLPILAKLDRRSGDRAPRALVLTPTRELAAQIAENAKAYGKYLDLRTVVVFGGVGINPQIDALRQGCDLLVATPGRLLDLAEQRARRSAQRPLRRARRSGSHARHGLHPRHQAHASSCCRTVRQNLMFSATYSEDIRELASRFVKNPATIEVAARNATADKVEQHAFIACRRITSGTCSRI